MSQSPLEIICEHKPDHIYTPGSNISGHLRFSVEKTTQCKEIYIECLWKTHGRGNVDKGHEHKIVLHTGEIKAGVYEYPFSMPLPEHPTTYHGEHINIDWYLSARADVPWSFDPKCECDFLLLPDDDSPEKSVSEFKAEEVFEKSESALPSGCLLGPLVLLLAATGLGISAWEDRDDFPAFRIFLLIPTIIMFFAASFMIIKRRMIHKRLGKINIAVSSLYLRPGEECAIAFSFTPQIQTQLNSATISLISQEHATSGSGTNSRTYSHEITRHDLVAHQGGILSANEKVELTHMLPIAHDAVPSFFAASNKITWIIRIELDIARCPDWSKEVHVFVSDSNDLEYLHSMKKNLNNSYFNKSKK